MKRVIASVCAAGLIALNFSSSGLAEEMCLSAAEIGDAGRMVAVMATGAALRRCAHCIGTDRYAQVLSRYEAAGLMHDFRKAQDTIKGREKYEYADSVVRQSARKYSEMLSSGCDACKRTADLLDGLTSPAAVVKFYEEQATKLSKLPAVRRCP
jgi:hypothetical protein